jgi:hypothetical protein
VAGKRTTFATVRAIGRELPDTEEGTSYGVAALKVNGRMFAGMASHKSAEPGTLVVYAPFEQRDALIEEEPETYYLKDHYVNYPVVLVRLSRVDRDALRDLLAGAWRFVREKSSRARSRSRRSRRPNR